MSTNTPDSVSQPAVDQLRQRLNQRLSYLDADPANISLYGDTVDLAIQLGEWDIAEQLFNRAPAGLPPDVVSNYRSVVYLATHRPDLALQVLLPLIERNPTVDRAVVYNAAYAHTLLGQFPEAIALLRVEPLEQLSDEAACLLLHALMLQGHDEDVLSLGQRFWISGRREPALLGLLALALSDTGAFDDALQVAAAALQQRPEANAWCAQAMALMEKEGAERARPAFEQALELEQRHGRAWLGLGMCQVVAGELPQAHVSLVKATQFNPNHPGSWHALGWTCLAQQNLGGAEAAFASALDVDRNFAETHGALAVVAIARGHREEAAQYVQVALRLDPRSLAGNYAKALLAANQGDEAKASSIVQSLMGAPALGGYTLAEAVQRMQRRR